MHPNGNGAPFEVVRLVPPPPGTVLDQRGQPAPARPGLRVRVRTRGHGPQAPVDHLAPALREALEGRRGALLVCQEGALSDEEYSTLALVDDLAAQETHAGAEPDVHVGGELRGALFVGARCEPLQVFPGDAYGVTRAVEKGLRTSVHGVTLTPEHLRAFSVRILAPTVEEGERVRDLLAAALPVGQLGARPQFAWCVRALPGLTRSLVSLWTDLARRELYDHAYHLYAHPDVRALLDAAERARTA